MKVCILTKKNEKIPIIGTIRDEAIISGIRMECYFSPHPAAELARRHIEIDILSIKYTVKGRMVH